MRKNYTVKWFFSQEEKTGVKNQSAQLRVALIIGSKSFPDQRKDIVVWILYTNLNLSRP